MNHPFYSRESHVRGGQTNEFEDRGNSSRWSTPSAALGWYEKERRNYYHKSSRKRVLLYAHCYCGGADQFPIAKYPNRFRSLGKRRGQIAFLQFWKSALFYFVLPYCRSVYKAIFISHYKIIITVEAWLTHKRKQEVFFSATALFYRRSFSPSSMNGVGDHKDKSGSLFIYERPFAQKFPLSAATKGQNTEIPDRELWFFKGFLSSTPKKRCFHYYFGSNWIRTPLLLMRFLEFLLP